MILKDIVVIQLLGALPADKCIGTGFKQKQGLKKEF